MAEALSDQEGPVVSDTTPLIVLAGVKLLSLLPALYGEVWIADAVWNEYTAGATPSEPALDTLPWLHRRSLERPVDPAIAARLDAGEAATIALAQQARARAVLLDEKTGRRLARDLTLPVVGTLAVLLRAKREGHIPALEPVLTEMVRQGRRLSPTLRAQVLRAAGE